MTSYSGAVRTAPQGLLAWEHARLDRITSGLELPQAKVRTLHCAALSVTANLQLGHEEGLTSVLFGLRVRHSSTLGPTKCGINSDPGALRARERHERSRCCLLAVLPMIGSEVKVLAPDQTMALVARIAGEAGAFPCHRDRQARAMELSGDIATQESPEG